MLVHTHTPRLPSSLLWNRKGVSSLAHSRPRLQGGSLSGLYAFLARYYTLKRSEHVASATEEILVVSLYRLTMAEDYAIKSQYNYEAVSWYCLQYWPFVGVLWDKCDPR